MVTIPGRCQRCGEVVATPPLIEADNVVDLRIEDVRQLGGCPRCGGDVEAITGRMNVVDGAIQMFSGPEWSWRLIEELGLALRQIVQERPEDPVGALTEVHPGLGKRIRAVTTGWPRDQILALLAVILTLFFGVDDSISSARAEQIQREILHVLKRAEQTGQTPQPTTLPGRNEPCWCGAPSKFKRCHGAPRPRASPRLGP